MCSYSSSRAEPTSGGWSHAPEEKFSACHAPERDRQRKMEEGVGNTLAMQRLSDLQDRVLTDTGVRLELTGGLALGVIDGVERLCMLCPGCRRPTVEVTACWAQCGHCGIQLTRLGPVQQEVKYYSANIATGLCRKNR